MRVEVIRSSKGRTRVSKDGKRVGGFLAPAVTCIMTWFPAVETIARELFIFLFRLIAFLGIMECDRFGLYLSVGIMALSHIVSFNKK